MNFGDTGSDVSDPVKLFDGTYTLTQTDLFVPGIGLNFNWVRTYLSKNGVSEYFYGRTNYYYSDVSDGSFTPLLPTASRTMPIIGGGWDHSYNMFVVGSGKLTGTQSDIKRLDIALFGGKNRVHIFRPLDPKDATGNVWLNRGYAGQMEYVGAGDSERIQLTLSDGKRYVFFPDKSSEEQGVNGARPPGFLEKIEDRHGNQITLAYAAPAPGLPGRLTTVTDTLGRVYLVEYATDLPPYIISGVTENFGAWRTVMYTQYTGATTPQSQVPVGGDQYDLESVEFDGGDGATGVVSKTWRFTYAMDHAFIIYDDGTTMRQYRAPLEDIISPNGDVTLHNLYYPMEGSTEFPQGLRVKDAVIQQVRNGKTFDYVYGDSWVDDNGNPVWATTVINRSGQVKLFEYSRNTRRLIARHDFMFSVQPSQRELFVSRMHANSSFYTQALRYMAPAPLAPDIAAWFTGSTSAEFNARKTEVISYMTNVRADVQPPAYSAVSEYSKLTQRPTVFLSPGGQAVQRSYEIDESGQIASAVGASPHRWNNVTSLRRISADIPTVGSAPEEISESWTYSAGFGGGSGCGCGSSFATSHTDGAGHRTEWDYNELGDVTEIRRLDSIGAVISTERFGYTDAGASGQDNDGRLLWHEYPDNNNGGELRRDTYEYYPKDDAQKGRRGKTQRVIVDSGGLNLTTTYDYDLVGNIKSVTDPLGRVTDSIYDGRGLLIERTEPVVAVSAGTLRRYRTRFVYDANDQLVREDSRIVTDANGTPILAGDEGFEPVRTTIHEYDVIGRRTRTSREVYGGIDPPLEQLESSGAGVSGGVDLLTAAPSAGAELYFVTTEFGYDANDNLVLVRNGEATSGAQPGNIVTRVYDERNLLFLETRGIAGGVSSTTRFDYDADMNLATRTEGYGSAVERSTTYAYDGFDRLRSITDALGNIVEYTYDKNDNRTTERRRGPAVAGGALVELAFTEFVYDGLDRLVESRARLFNSGVESSAASNPVARIARVYNADSSVRAVSVYRSDTTGDTTTYAYDLAGRVTTITDPFGNTTDYTYDANSNVTGVASSELRADPMGGGAVIVDRFATTTTYDALDRVSSTTDGAGNTTTYRYDAVGNLVLLKDARWNETTYAYDGLNRLVQTRRLMTGSGEGPAPGTTVTNPVYITTSQVWDASSRLIAQIDDNGNATRYAYDELNRLRGTRYADGTLSMIGGLSWNANTLRPSPGGFSGYDAVGNPLQFSDANGTIANSTFDALGRVTARSILRGLDVVGTTQEQYWYDGLSRLLAALDDDTYIERRYDSLSRMTRETSFLVVGGTPTWARQVGYDYDLAGNTTRITYPGGRVVEQEFDALGRIRRINSSPIGGGAPVMLAEYAYAGPGRVDRRAYANATETRYEYDGRELIPNNPDDHGFGRISRITHNTPVATLDDRVIAWDAAQNKKAFTVTGGLFPYTREFTYDSASRLVSSIRRINGAPELLASYTLDGVHNRTSVFGSLDSGAQIGAYAMSVGGPGYDLPVNQYSTTPSSRLGYDPNGNLTRFDAQASGGLALDLIAGPGGGSQAVRDSSSVAIAEGGSAFDLTADSLVSGEDVAVMIDLANAGAVSGTIGSLRAATVRYDYRNQMVEYAADDGFGPHAYLYDALGRRVAKRVADGQIGQVVGTRFISAGNTRSAATWQTIEEYDEGAQMLTASYIHGNYIDEVLSMRRADGSGVVRDFYFHQDDLFNVTMVTDASGAAVERYEYGDYGAPRFFDGGGAALGSSALSATRLFNGREWDAEIAMYYYRTRYLEPSLGRFTARDLIGVWGDEGNFGNGVAYVGGQPEDATDPFGKCADVSGCKSSLYACRRKAYERFTHDRQEALNDYTNGLRNILDEAERQFDAIRKLTDSVEALCKSQCNATFSSGVFRSACRLGCTEATRIPKGIAWTAYKAAITAAAAEWTAWKLAKFADTAIALQQDMNACDNSYRACANSAGCDTCTGVPD